MFSSSPYLGFNSVRLDDDDNHTTLNFREHLKATVTTEFFKLLYARALALKTRALISSRTLKILTRVLPQKQSLKTDTRNTRDRSPNTALHLDHKFSYASTHLTVALHLLTNVLNICSLRIRSLTIVLTTTIILNFANTFANIAESYLTRSTP